ncbi:hypothetical protein KSS87_019246 [Heliosperma pusillum]|nr:hypothetical protein KSS87_019246 [Heliosperma pusillum]
MKKMHCFFNLLVLYNFIVIGFSSTSSLATNTDNSRYGWRLVAEGKSGEWKLVAPSSLIISGDYTAITTNGATLSSRRNLRSPKWWFYRQPSPSRNEASHGGGGNGGIGGGIG